MLDWIKRHRVLMIIFAAILIFVVILSISYSRGNLGFLSRGTETVNSVVEKPLSGGVGWLRESARGIFRFRSVVNENEELQEEISRLNRENIRIQLENQELEELRELSAALNYQTSPENSNHVTADISAVDGSGYFNIFTIGAGTEAGIAENAIVVNGKGLVGMISETGSRFSKVISIIDQSSSVSFSVLGKLEIMGIVEGDGNGMLGGYTFDSDADVKEGDTLITSGLGVYPAGIPIGTVKNVVFDKDTQLKTITVEPAVSFNSMKRVMVLI